MFCMWRSRKVGVCENGAPKKEQADIAVSEVMANALKRYLFLNIPLKAVCVVERTLKACVI